MENFVPPSRHSHYPPYFVTMTTSEVEHCESLPPGPTLPTATREDWRRAGLKFGCSPNVLHFAFPIFTRGQFPNGQRGHKKETEY